MEGKYVLKLLLLSSFIGVSKQFFIKEETPVIKRISYDYTSNGGSDVEILCYVESSTLANITWYYEGEPVNEDRTRTERSTYYFRQYEMVAHLIIGEFNEFHSGQYTCEARNELGKCNATVNLMIRKVDLLGRDCSIFPEECRRLNQMPRCLGDDPSCKCTSKEIYSNGRCFSPVPLGGVCHGQEECLFSDLNSECVSSPLGPRCMCRNGFQTSKNGKCVEDELIRGIRHAILATICFVFVFAAITLTFILANNIRKICKSKKEIPFKRLMEVK